MSGLETEMALLDNALDFLHEMRHPPTPVAAEADDEAEAEEDFDDDEQQPEPIFYGDDPMPSSWI